MSAWSCTVLPCYIWMLQSERRQIPELRAAIIAISINKIYYIILKQKGYRRNPKFIVMNESFTSIENLLRKIGDVKNTYDRIAKIKGENFNIFKILGLTTSEVRLHSAFIAELLNPNGTHERGVVFLAEFLNLINSKLKKGEKPDSIEAQNVVSVDVEFWTGYKTDTDGGYIDILITDKFNRQIIIENKINAGDQENQLLRYHSFDRKALIVYLTPQGIQPSDFSTGKSDEVLERTFCISYKTDILNWLENCKKYISDHSTLRETITQYAGIIKHLTNQSIKKEEMDETIGSIIRERSLLEALQYADDNNLWAEAKKRILLTLEEKIVGEEGICKELGLKVHFDKKWTPFGTKGTEFWYYKVGWKYCIYFCFESDFLNIWCGIDILKDGDSREDPEREKFKQLLNGFSSTNHEKWIWKTKFTEYENEPWFDLQTTGPGLFKAKIRSILDRVEGIME